jgi:hypothetical protein
LRGLHPSQTLSGLSAKTTTFINAYGDPEERAPTSIHWLGKSSAIHVHFKLLAVAQRVEGDYLACDHKRAGKGKHR